MIIKNILAKEASADYLVASKLIRYLLWPNHSK